jgi:hypothetical protein
VSVEEAETFALAVRKTVGHLAQRICGETSFNGLTEFIEPLTGDGRDGDNRRSSAGSAFGLGYRLGFGFAD